MTHKKGLVTLLSALAVVGISVGIARYLAMSAGDDENLFAAAPRGHVMESEWPTKVVDLGAGMPEARYEPVPVATPEPVVTPPVAQVQPVAATPAPRPQPTPSRPAPATPARPAAVTPPAVKMVPTTAFWVQAGSYSSLARAHAARDSLLVLGLAGTIHTVTHEDRLLYRLRFGAWESEEEATRFRDYLRNTESLRMSFNELKASDRSNDFADAFVVSTTLKKPQSVI